MNYELGILPGSRKGEVAELLASEFGSDLMFQKFIPRNRKSNRGGIEAFFSLACDLHAEQGMPFLAATSSGRIVGVATLHPPTGYRPLSRVARLRHRLRRIDVFLRLGVQGWKRITRYSAAVLALRPPPPFHYIGNIAVLSSHRRAGIRRELLRIAIERVARDPASRGLVLDTFKPSLAATLEGEGWAVSGPVVVGEIMAFSAFMQKSVHPAQAELELAPDGPLRVPQVK